MEPSMEGRKEIKNKVSEILILLDEVKEMACANLDFSIQIKNILLGSEPKESKDEEKTPTLPGILNGFVYKLKEIHAILIEAREYKITVKKEIQ